VYEYSGVDVDTFDRINASDSVGRALREEVIRNPEKYPYREISPDHFATAPEDRGTHSVKKSQNVLYLSDTLFKSADFVSEEHKTTAYKNSFGKGHVGVSSGDTPSQSPDSGQSSEKLRGGVADGRGDSAFAKEKLRAGKHVEKEHTDDSDVAGEIAKDHLSEDSDYYEKLKKIEKSIRLYVRV